MDFATRDRYRHVVERLARRSGKPERVVAAACVAMARARAKDPAADPRETHVGYFLVERGRAALERDVGYRPAVRESLRRAMRRPALVLYLGAAAVLTAALGAGLVAGLAPQLLEMGRPIAAAAVVLAALAASQPALTLVNWLVTLLAPSRPLPRMDFARGIPAEHRTVVVIPTMLSGEEAVDSLLEGLEIRHLGNRGPNLLFALLTDFTDAPHEAMTGDEALVERAVAGVRALNDRYAEPGRPLFFLLHRPRAWNEREGVWMGFERKRGKLLDFNRLLRTGETAPFSVIEGDVALLRTCRYVISLDTDTQLPPEAAHRMVGSMAHPLNRPRIDPARGCVVDGYGILQPRVGVGLAGASRSLFARLFSGEVGIDPYTREVSNVYHDLFGRGQFIGKGIYDLEAFDRTCAGRFPENRILSHDLIEGCHARAGFLNDVELVEDHPAAYLADVSRRHRWVRGDWQIAAWLLPRVPGSDGRWTPNFLDYMARWMIFDNLRRSLVPAAMLALLAGGWFVLPAAGAWTLGVLGLALVPDVVRPLWALVRKPHKALWAAHVRKVAKDAARQAAIDALALALLPFEAAFHADSIVRSVWRIVVSRRGLLQWQTSEDAQRRLRVGLLATFRAMAPGPVAALALAGGVAAIDPAALPVAVPVLAVWLTAPALALVLSQPIRPRGGRFAAAEERFLRGLARRTWMYFEHFTGPEQNDLPPDNYQEQPQGRVAERTSPTNIGLGLLAVLAAHDLGYLPAGDLLDRLGRTFNTLDRLQRFRDHFLNWYDTRTLQALPPHYVSSVDSGNLSCTLIVLKARLLELANAPLLPPAWRRGLADTAAVAREEARAAAGRTSEPEARDDLRRVATDLGATVDRLGAAASGRLPGVLAALATLEEDLRPLASPARHDAETGFWLATLQQNAQALREDAARMAPWTAVLAEAPQALGGTVASARAGAAAVAEVRAVADEARAAADALGAQPTLQEAAALEPVIGPRLDDLAARATRAGAGALAMWLERLREAVGRGSEAAVERIHELRRLAQRAGEMADIDLEFLYDAKRKLLTIGWSLDAHRPDPGYYDLFASEARACSYMGVAQGKLPQEHWFLLGRQTTPGLEMPSLMSWSGSMFEYLMPLLFMPSYEGTLLDAACRGAVRRQRAYARRHGVPWGISESCYNQVDIHMNYQYRAFGVPDLGLKRGLADDLVVAPYASALALLTLPQEACSNLQRLARMGMVGRYGLYEAVDFTQSRVPADQAFAVVRSFMAHHQGMTLLALAHALEGAPMQRRFLADPEMRSATLLLQERVPLARTSTRLERRPAPEAHRDTGAATREAAMRVYTDRDDLAVPAVHLLSNGQYHVMITSAGGGFSRFRNTDLTRWRMDATRDAHGFFFYLRDADDGAAWSAAQQPLCRKVDRSEAIFSQARAEFRVTHRHIEAYTQVAVSPEDNVELRRIQLTNISNRHRTLELTSFGEVVLADLAQERSHPAFNALFVQTHLVPDRHAVLCTRRPRSAEETPPWMFHAVLMPNEAEAEPASFETDRARFLGRLRSAANPDAMRAPGPLSGTAGSVLDPCVAVRRRIRLAPGEVVTIDAIMGIGEDREQALALVDRYHDRRLADRVFELAWTQSQILLHQLRCTEADAQVFARLASSIVYPNDRYRAGASLLARNRKGQADLWRFGISGDLPIVLVRVTDASGLDLLRKVLQAHGYWRHKGLRVDLVVWADAFSGYRQSLWDLIMGLINTGPGVKALDQPGGVFVRSTDQLPEDDRLLMQSAAAVVLSDRAGSLADQADRRRRRDAPVPDFRPSRHPDPPLPGEAELLPRDLDFRNGLGGFTKDGREYVIEMRPGQATPAPWSNVLANRDFGTVVTESGGAYTWFENAHEFRLTPWLNDPVGDPCGEACYLRDEETGRFWSVTPRPAPGRNPYVCRHGLGYTVFEHTQDGLFTEAHQYVAVDGPLKFVTLKIRNVSGRDRRLSVTGYAEWVLGESRARSGQHVVTRIDPQTGAIMASCAYNVDFADNVAFFQCSEPDRSVTGDRREFIGRNRSLADPAALARQRLSNRVGAGLDPCAAIQAFIVVPAGQERLVVFVLGAARGEQAARSLLYRYAGADGAWMALEAVWDSWKRLLGGVYVETPDPTVDLLVNHWLLYQVVAARFWGRSGFYQSGGAWGFRDQLQDSLAMLCECPDMVREHLLRCSARQFREGDVQHWWHEPTGRGVRTKISDDYLWLPYVVCRYVEATGDTGVLDETAAFLDGRPLEPGEESYYDLPHVTDDRATLYEHCARSVRHGLRFGSHGLPLMGAGDWNDGLNRVGLGGQGESVWLGFFLHDVLTKFAALADARKDDDLARRCRQAAETLRANLEEHGWDGRWYRRAYFDNGHPLGSHTNLECRIDSLPQSWAVLSGAARPERAEMAMQSVMEHLVDWQLGLIRLFTPPFDKAPWDPGYIKGYVPGVRENGGQYTHAAVWVALAFARMHETEHAWRLLAAINPIRHADTPEKVAVYKVEPYVLAADVYTAAGHEGRGGWTWYTGSASWMYRLLIEGLLGLDRRGESLSLAPVVPQKWGGFTIHYRHRNTQYHIVVTIKGPKTWKVRRVRVDDRDQPDKRIPLVDDRQDHVVRVTVG
jgi:cellobiose phosphorylase